MEFRINDQGDRSVRLHGEIRDAGEIDALLDELEVGRPRVWQVWCVGSKTGVTFAIGDGVCGLVQWARDGGPPWWFLVAADPIDVEGGRADWNGQPWELYPHDFVSRDELRQVLQAFVSSGGKRDPKSRWDKVDE